MKTPQKKKKKNLRQFLNTYLFPDAELRWSGLLIPQNFILCLLFSDIWAYDRHQKGFRNNWRWTQCHVVLTKANTELNWGSANGHYLH